MLRVCNHMRAIPVVAGNCDGGIEGLSIRIGYRAVETGKGTFEVAD